MDPWRINTKPLRRLSWVHAGVTVPPNTLLFPIVWHAQHDPAVWGAPPCLC